MSKAKPLIISGRIIRGTGRGKIFISIPEYFSQFARILGCEPHAGTLNILVMEAPEKGEMERLRERKGIRINGFERDGRRYLPGIAVPCLLRLKESMVQGLLYFPEKTVHPPDVMEVISCERILNLVSMGERVVIKL